MSALATAAAVAAVAVAAASAAREQWSGLAHRQRYKDNGSGHRSRAANRLSVSPAQPRGSRACLSRGGLQYPDSVPAVKVYTAVLHVL